MLFAKRHMPGLVALALLLGAVVLKAASQAGERGEPVHFNADRIPAEIAGWRFVKDVGMPASVHEMLLDDARNWRIYRRGNEVADLLVLYGHRKRTFHMPEQCLAGAGMTVANRRRVSLRLPGNESPVPFEALTLQKDGAINLALYTFVGPDGKATDLLGLNMGIFMCRVRGEKPKGAVIRVIGPMDPDKPIESQSICPLAASVLKVVGSQVRQAGTATEAGSACSRPSSTLKLELT